MQRTALTVEHYPKVGIHTKFAGIGEIIDVLFQKKLHKALVSLTAAALVFGGSFAGLAPGSYFAPGHARAAGAVQNAGHVVISQIYAGGTDNPSKGDSTFTHDYIELYNPTDEDVTLTGWSIQYVPYNYSNGGSWNVIPLGTDTGKPTTIKAHGYYLIKGNHGNFDFGATSQSIDDTYADTVAPGSFPHLSKDGGVIALVKDSTTPLAVSNPQGTDTIDFVGYGTSSKTPKAYEGAAYALDGSYKKAIIRKGVNTETGTVAVPGSSESTGYGNGYDSDNNDLAVGKNTGDFQQLDNGVFSPRNSSVREPRIKGSAVDSSSVSMSADNTTIRSDKNQFSVTLTIGAVRSGALTEGTDYEIQGLPPGSFTSSATGSSADNSIAFTLNGTAASPIAADAELQIVVKGAALSPAGAYPDSLAIGGIKVLYASAVPKAAGTVVAGSDKLVMSGLKTIGQASFAIQLDDAVHVRTNTAAVPLAASADYSITGLPTGLTVSAEADTAANRIVFTAANPNDAVVLDDADLSVVIKGGAVQETGATDSDAITGISLQRYKTAVDTSPARKALVEQQLVADNTFFMDPATKAYKYSGEALGHDPFTFFRGTNAVYLNDLGKSPLPLAPELTRFAGMKTFIQGDAHIQNVGIFNDSAGTPIFDLNDADAASPDTFYIDLLRFVTSLYVVKYDADTTGLLSLTTEEIRAVARQFIDTYQTTLQAVSGNDTEKTAILTAAQVQAYTASVIGKVVGSNDYMAARQKQATKWMTESVADTSKYQTATDAEKAGITAGWEGYKQSIRSAFPSLTDSQFNDYFTVKSTVRRINQGMGSIGSIRYNVLIEGPSSSANDDIVLDVKEQRRAADLTVQAYKAMSINPDTHLGVLTADKSYLVREISPYKGDYTKKTFASKEDFRQYAIDSAKAYAYAHARSDRDSAVGGLTNSFDDDFAGSVAGEWDTLGKMLVNAGEDYAGQVVADYNLLKDDMLSGKLIDVSVLSGLSLSGVTLSPAFSSDTFTYNASVANEVTSTTISASALDSSAVITEGDLGTKQLTVGNNVMQVHVTARDGKTTSVYTINVNRSATVSQDASLSALSLSGVTLSPAFQAGVLAYNANVTPQTTGTTVTTSAYDNNATVVVNVYDSSSKLVAGPHTVTGGQPSPAIALAEGKSRIDVQVTAAFGNQTTYSVTVNRSSESGGNAYLQSLLLSQGNLAFNKLGTEYVVQAGRSIDSLTVTAAPEVAGAKVRINSEETLVKTIAINDGDNEIAVQVTSPDGTASMTYRIVVKRAPAQNASSGEPVQLTNEPVSISVPSGVTNASVAVTTVTSGDVKTATVPLVEVQAVTPAGNITLAIPSGTQITAPAGWDGTIRLPEVLSSSAVSIGRANVGVVIEVGSPDYSLTFDKAVRLLIPNQGGKSAGYVRNGVFTPITATLSADMQGAADSEIAAGGDAKITVGNDLIVWTKHFTKFASFTPISSDNSSSGSGGSGAPSNSGTIGAAGGKLTLSGVTIEMPSGASDSLVRVTVNKMNDLSALPIDSKLKLAGEAFEITSSKDGEYQAPLTITSPYDKTKADYAKLTYALYSFDEQSRVWVQLGNATVDRELGTAAGTTRKLGKFAVLASENKAETTPAVPQETEKAPFGDTQGHWAEASIKELVKLGAINGYPDGSFKPNGSITRAEFITVVVQAFRLTSPQSKTFADTKGHWADKAIGTAAALDVIGGYSDASFGPDDLVTREQMAAIVVRAAGLKVGEQPSSFADNAQISDWARQALGAAVSNGLLTGYEDGTVKPKANTTRAEAAAIVLRAVKLNK